VPTFPATSNGGALATTAIMLEAKSATGDCYFVVDETAAAPAVAPIYAVGTAYEKVASCTSANFPTVGPLASATPAANSTTASVADHVWAANF
jgi:hypothetical protein